MKKLTDKMLGNGDKIKKLVPHALIVLLLILGVVLLYAEFGAVSPVQAQVNLGQIGSTITETIGEAASETAGEYAEAEAEIEGAVPEPEPVDEDELPPPESVEVEPEVILSQEQAEVLLEQFYTSTEGIGGKHFMDLEDDEIWASLNDIVIQLAGVDNPAFVDGLMPIFQRFQIMVRPPVDQVSDWEQPPWESGERRYSPFDAPGMVGPHDGLGTRPLPPFPSENVYGPGVVRGPEPTVTAAMVASLIRLKGVLAEGDNYVAILLMQGQEQRVKVGDHILVGGQVLTIGDKTWIITEIDMNSVKIETDGDPNDVGVIHFGERTQIQNFSISYD